MYLLITFVCAVVGAWFFLGGIASFIAPSAAAPSMGSSAVLGGVLLAIAFIMWRGRKHMAAFAAGQRNWAVRNADVVERLPDIEGFRRAAQSLAALDALLTPDWQHRFYSFDARWSGEHQLASMRNGCGDQWFARIGADGIVVHGLLHESPDFVVGKPKPWVFGELPRELGASFLTEPAFDTSNSTFCLWRTGADSRWSRGSIPASAADDGSHELLELLWTGAVGYRSWAEEYYETRLELADVEAFFRHDPLTRERAHRMNPEADFAALERDLAAIGSILPSARSESRCTVARARMDVMHTPSRTPQWSDTLMMLVGTSVFFMPLAYLLFLHLLVARGLGSNSEPVDPFDAEPSSSFVPESPSPTWLFPTLCALGVVVPMVIAIRIVVRHRA